VAARTGVPPLDPWFLNTQAAPALDAVEIEAEDAVVSGPGIGILINPGGTRAARTGVPPYYIAGPSVPPAAEAPASPPKTHAEAAARIKAQALPSPPPAEALPTSMLRRLLGRKTAAVDRRPGLRRTGAWNPTDLGLPRVEVLVEREKCDCQYQHITCYVLYIEDLSIEFLRITTRFTIQSPSRFE